MWSFTDQFQVDHHLQLISRLRCSHVAVEGTKALAAKHPDQIKPTEENAKIRYYALLMFHTVEIPQLAKNPSFRTGMPQLTNIPGITVKYPI